MRPLSRLLVLALLLAAGCLFSTTRVFEFDVIGNANLSTPLHLQDTQVGEARVELIRARAYEESVGDIEVVDRAGFTATIQNLAGSPGTLSLYLSGESGLTDPASTATRLLTLEVPSAGRTLSFEESEDLIEHFSMLRDAIEAGEFHLYVLAAAGSDLEVETLRLVVSMTVDS